MVVFAALVVTGIEPSEYDGTVFVYGVLQTDSTGLVLFSRPMVAAAAFEKTVRTETSLFFHG